jgi:hypothetical protein
LTLHGPGLGTPVTTALLAVTLVACGVAGSPVPSVERVQFFLPQHDQPLGSGDSARLEGTVAFEDGCVWVRTGDATRYLVLWPADAEAGEINDLPAVLGPDGGLLVETGSPTALGGSETDLTTATELVGEIPDACASDAFWVVSTVEMRPGGAPS